MKNIEMAIDHTVQNIKDDNKQMKFRFNQGWTKIQMYTIHDSMSWDMATIENGKLDFGTTNPDHLTPQLVNNLKKLAKLQNQL